MGKYMIRPVLALERLTFLELDGKVGYRYYGLYANAHRGKVKKASLSNNQLGDLRAHLDRTRLSDATLSA